MQVSNISTSSNQNFGINISKPMQTECSRLYQQILKKRKMGLDGLQPEGFIQILEELKQLLPDATLNYEVTGHGLFGLRKEKLCSILTDGKKFTIWADKPKFSLRKNLHLTPDEISEIAANVKTFSVTA